jgi:hypothetical protein
VTPSWRSEFLKKSLQRKIAELELFEGSQSFYKHLPVFFCHGTTASFGRGKIIRPVTAQQLTTHDPLAPIPLRELRAESNARGRNCSTQNGLRQRSRGRERNQEAKRGRQQHSVKTLPKFQSGGIPPAEVTKWGGYLRAAPHFFPMQTDLRLELLGAGYQEIFVLRLAHCGCDWRTFRRVNEDREYSCPACGQLVKVAVLGTGFTRREIGWEQTAWPLRYRGLDPAPTLRRKRPSQDARHHAGNQYTAAIWE